MACSSGHFRAVPEQLYQVFATKNVVVTGLRDMESSLLSVAEPYGRFLHTAQLERNEIAPLAIEIVYRAILN